MEWLKSALAKVYGNDGLVGVVVIVALVAGLWWLFGADVIELLK